MSIFRPLKLHRKKYVETMWIFWPSKLSQKTFVETTWIFWLAKLHRKSTWKWRENFSKFGLQRLDVISASNPRLFDVECLLGSFKILKRHCVAEQNLRVWLRVLPLNHSKTCDTPYFVLNWLANLFFIKFKPYIKHATYDINIFNSSN